MNERVKHFRDCCRLLDQDKEESKAAADSLGQMVEEDMPQEYGIPYSPEGTLKTNTVPDEQARHYRGLWHELVQHLTDLGYLSDKEFVAYHKRRRSAADDPVILSPVLKAARTYLAEEEWPELAEIYTGDFSDIQLYHLEQYLGQLVERIARYTSFDGVLPPPAAYQLGQVNCYGRSLAYRLRTLITFDKKLHDVYVCTEAEIGYLFNLDQILELELLKKPDHAIDLQIPKRFWEIIADIDVLYEKFRDAKPPGTRKRTIALVYSLTANRSMQEAEVSLSASPSLGTKPRWTKNLVKDSERITSRPYNFLGIRILQVKLWQTNFYIGAVDGTWGTVSHEAVEQLIAQEKEMLAEESPQLKRRQIKDREKLLARAQTKLPGESTYVVGLAPLYTLLAHYHSTASAPEESVENILEDLKNQDGVDDEAIDKKVLHDDAVGELYPDAAKKPRRRVAYTRVSFWQGIKRGIKRIGRWIAKTIKKLLGPIFGFVKLILGRIRSSIQRFFRGFRYLGYFLLGKPIVTLARPLAEGGDPMVMATKFGRDWDGYNLINDEARPEDIDRHSAHIKDMKDSMFYFIDSTVKIIKAIGKLTQPGGWVWLGLKIARFLLEEVVDIIV